MRIRRGGHWGRALCNAMAQPPSEPAEWVESHTRLLKRDAHSRVGLLSVEGEPCYLKLYLGKSPWQRLAFRLGFSRALHSFDRGLELGAAGVPVPEPRACLLLPGAMVLLTEAIAGSDLKSLWQAGADAGPQAEQLMTRAGDALAGLHRAGFSHGDCKWSNLLCSPDQLYFADLEAVGRAPAGSAGAARDLARFTLNAEDLAVAPASYEAFLASYVAGTGQERQQVVETLLPSLRGLRTRHLGKYGERGHRLLD